MIDFNPDKYGKQIEESRKRHRFSARFAARGFYQVQGFPGQVFWHTVFSGGLNCKDLYYDFETAKPAVDRAIRIGAPGGGFTLAVGGETYVGVNPDTLIQVVKYAKEAGKYPITL